MELINKSSESKSKFLIFSSIGNHANIEKWFGDGRNYDIWLTRYSDSPSAYEADAEYFNIRKGGKFQNLKYAMEQWPEVFDRYDYVWIADDDIALTVKNINKLFSIAKNNALNLSQPSFDRRGKISYEATIENPMTKLRYTNFVEMTCPVIDMQSLKYFIEHFDQRLTGYGTDWMLSHYLHLKDSDIKIAIIDSLRCFNPRDGVKGGQREIDQLQSHAERKRIYEEIKHEVGMTIDENGLLVHSKIYETNPFLLGYRVLRKYVIDRIVSRARRIIRQYKQRNQ